MIIQSLANILTFPLTFQTKTTIINIQKPWIHLRRFHLFKPLEKSLETNLPGLSSSSLAARRARTPPESEVAEPSEQTGSDVALGSTKNAPDEDLFLTLCRGFCKKNELLMDLGSKMVKGMFGGIGSFVLVLLVFVSILDDFPYFSNDGYCSCCMYSI